MLAPSPRRRTSCRSSDGFPTRRTSTRRTSTRRIFTRRAVHPLYLQPVAWLTHRPNPPHPQPAGAPLITLPFTIRWQRYDRTRYIRTRSLAYGLARLDAEALVLQYRVRHRHSQGGVTVSAPPDSEVLESRIPLSALRSARVVRRWWRTRVVLSAADMHGFQDLPGVVHDQLVLAVDRAHRADAADLASSLELALTTRLLDRTGPLRLPDP
jgi:hypothetical protein